MGFADQVRRSVSVSRQNLDAVIRQTVTRVAARIITPSPVDTGLFKGSWRWTQGGQDRTVPQTQDRVGTATIAAAADEIARWDFRQIGYLQNNQPYAIALENGHSKQADSMVRNGAMVAPIIAGEEARRVNGGA